MHRGEPVCYCMEVTKTACRRGKQSLLLSFHLQVLLSDILARVRSLLMVKKIQFKVPEQKGILAWGRSPDTAQLLFETASLHIAEFPVLLPQPSQCWIWEHPGGFTL